MSGSERLIVSTAIVRRLNPECGFVLLDKLEQMDMQTLAEFGQWLEAEGLQAIATRVSTGDECSIIIEDGCVAGQKNPSETKKEWKAGAFLMNITRGKKNTAKKVVVYSLEGSARARLPAASRIRSLSTRKAVPMTWMWPGLTKPPAGRCFWSRCYVVKNPSVCKTLVIDTADWAEQMCMKNLCDSHNKKGIEDFGYGNGYVYAKEEWGKFLNLLQEVVEKGVHVVVTTIPISGSLSSRTSLKYMTGMS